MNSAEVAKQVTQKILEELRSNPGKWIKSWETTRPRNLITGHEYSGFNWMWLNMNTDEKHGMSPYWMTYNQAKQITESNLYKRITKQNQSQQERLMSQDVNAQIMQQKEMLQVYDEDVGKAKQKDGVMFKDKIRSLQQMVRERSSLQSN